jgi:hypothetical protein
MLCLLSLFTAKIQKSLGVRFFYEFLNPIFINHEYFGSSIIYVKVLLCILHKPIFLYKFLRHMTCAANLRHIFGKYNLEHTGQDKCVKPFHVINYFNLFISTITWELPQKILIQNSSSSSSSSTTTTNIIIIIMSIIKLLFQNNKFSLMAQQLPVGQGVLIIKASRSHSVSKRHTR